MATPHESFPPIICRGCGRHGLSVDEAKEHLGKGRSYCRGGDPRARDQSCTVCGDSFVDHVYIGINKPRSCKRVWRGKRIYSHKMKHLREGE